MDELIKRLDLLEKRLERQLKQNMMLNDKIGQIVANQNHYLRKRSVEREAKKTWQKKVMEINNLYKALRNKVGIFHHLPDKITGEGKALMWLTRNQRSRLMEMLEPGYYKNRRIKK